MNALTRSDINKLNNLKGKRLKKTYLQCTIEKFRDLEEDCDVSPFFQRSLVWPKATKLHFLKSSIEGVPTHAMVVIKSEEGNFVMDGKQRFTTLKEAKSDEDLSAGIKKRIDDFPIATFFIDKSAFKTTQDLVNCFNYLNKGTRISSYELTRAIYYESPFIKFVTKEVNTQRFKNFIKLFSDNDTTKRDTNLNRLTPKSINELLILKILVTYFREDFSTEWKFENEIVHTLTQPGITQEGLSKAFQTCYEAFNVLYGGGKNRKSGCVLPLAERSITTNASFTIPAIVGLLAKQPPSAIKAKQTPLRAFFTDFWTMKDSELRDKHNLKLTGGSGGTMKVKFNLINNKIKRIFARAG